ncbi:MAG: ComEC/Rec2 family competence protein [Waddliaceae bacterium]
MFVFFSRAPALLYGIFAVFGCAVTLADEKWLPLTILGISAYLAKQRGIAALLIASIAAMTTSIQYQFPKETERVENGHLQISKIEKQAGRFSSTWVYKGLISNTPCYLSLPQKKDSIRPAADSDYLVSGTLNKSPRGQYFFKPDIKKPWTKVKNHLSLAEMRFQKKRKVKEVIKKNYRNKKVAVLLQGLSTGEFDDAEMKRDFSRFGLQHLMAISGFHFSLLAAIFGGFASLIFRGRLAEGSVLLGMSTYFYFLGPSASVIRAFCAIFLRGMGKLIGRELISLNALGIALLIIAIFNPPMFFECGCIFSFCITASILLYSSLCDEMLTHWIQDRPFEQVMQMPFIDRTCFYFLILLRKVIALACAVNVTAIPLTLYFFGKFPILSIFYNLFYPFAISLSIFMLLIGMAAGFLFPTVGLLVHAVNEKYTEILLDLTENMPLSLDLTLTSPEIAPFVITGYLFLVFAYGIYMYDTQKERVDWIS